MRYSKTHEIRLLTDSCCTIYKSGYLIAMINHDNKTLGENGQSSICGRDVVEDSSGSVGHLCAPHNEVA